MIGPETIIAVPGLPEGDSVYFACAEHVTSFSWMLPEPQAALKGLILDHMAEYPGPVRLVGMTAREREEAAAAEKQTGRPVMVSWRKFPGVVE